MEKIRHDLLFTAGILTLLNYFINSLISYFYSPENFIEARKSNLLIYSIYFFIVVFMAVSLIIGKKTRLLGISFIFMLCYQGWNLFTLIRYIMQHPDKYSNCSYDLFSYSIIVVFYLLLILSVFWKGNIIERKFKFLYTFVPICLYVMYVFHVFFDATEVIEYFYIAFLNLFIAPLYEASLMCMGAGISGMTKRDKIKKYNKIGFTGIALFLCFNALVLRFGGLCINSRVGYHIYQDEQHLIYANIIAVLVILLSIAFFMSQFAFLHDERIYNESLFSLKDINKSDLNVLKYLLLSIVTLGIWNIVFVYRTTRYLNEVMYEEIYGPTTEVLLYLFVPFYSVCWFYRCGRKMEAIAKFKGYDCNELAVSLMFLRAFGWIFANIYLQIRLKGIISAPDNKLVITAK